jgi:hypothetical protein
MIDVTTPGAEYRQSAVDKFNALKAAYASNDPGKGTPFWKLGNSFDTMTDFLETIDSSSAHDVARMAVQQYAASTAGGVDGFWFDDFGWWSVATSRALEKPFFKADAEAIRGILKVCWKHFDDNAPHVWERHEPRTFDDYAPAVEGGVWNAYWSGTSNEYEGPKGGDPSEGLEGIQNTVTNALYLNTAHRLGHTDSAAREAARRELEFFLTWFDETETPLWWAVDKDTGLVRERVGHFANGSPAWGFQENFAWAGDQGLMLGNLSDAMLHQPPGFRGPLLSRLKQLLEGVRQCMTTKGVLGGYTDTGSPPDNENYQTGSGIFWRNALYAWNTNPDLQVVLKGKEYQAMIRASAEAAKKPDDGTIQALTNDTAALVAACAMLV